jgi:hypothetical protein
MSKSAVEEYAEERAKSRASHVDKLRRARQMEAAALRDIQRHDANEEARHSDDAEHEARIAFEHEQQYYLRKCRKDITGLRKREDSLTHKGYVIFEHIFKEWIRKEKPLEGVEINYERLERVSGLGNRQVRTWVARLLRGYAVKTKGKTEWRIPQLIPVAGFRGGRNVKLKVVPNRYPWKMGEDGEPMYTQQLVEPSLPKPKRRTKK